MFEFIIINFWSSNRPCKYIFYALYLLTELINQCSNVANNAGQTIILGIMIILVYCGGFS